MDLSKMTNEEARAIVAQAQNVFDASIADQQRSSPKEIQSLPLDLTVARTRSNAMKVSFPFKSVLVEQASDLSTYVYMIPISNDSGNDPIRLGLKDIYKNEFGFRECYIYWDAQPLKQIILKFFVRSIIENGRLVLDQNSIPSTLTIGEASSQNDSQTFLLNTVLFFPSNNFSLISPLYGYNDSSLNKGSYSPNNGVSFNGDQFKVPMGYSAEILGCEIVCGVTTTSTNWEVDFLAIKDGSIFASPSAMYYGGYCVATFMHPAVMTQNPIPIKKYISNIPASFTGSVATAFTPPRSKRIFYENECIVAMITNFVSANVGNVEVRLIVRITKNVG